MHPAIALAHLKPYAYGNRFYKDCKTLLGSILGVPSRDTVAACLMLAHVAFANGTRDALSSS